MAGHERPLRWRVTSRGCWEVTSHTPGSNGYPCFTRGGKYQKISRYVFRDEFGEIPHGKIVRHRCDNPLCANPRHLLLGDHAENAKDRNERGRTARGERHGMAKLTAPQVRRIRCFLASGMKEREVAKIFGVSQSTIGWISRGEHWVGA